jgi:REP element-mobilizing transposase RayT
MRPDADATNRIAGVIGRAQAMYPVKIHAIIVLSNHLQMLLSVRDARQLADFMGYVDGNISKEIGALRGWRQRFWGRRYRAIVVADEQAQIARLRYVFANSCKEGLVATPKLWPGVSSARAFMTGEPIIGTWYDRTAERRLRKGGGKPPASAFSERYEVQLSPVPCKAHLSPMEYRTLCKNLISGLVDEVWEERGPHGFLGAVAVLAQDPQSRPAAPSRSPAPFVHASCRETRMAFRRLLQDFTDACCHAAASLLGSQSTRTFPQGALLPGGKPAHPPDHNWPSPFTITIEPDSPLLIPA